MEHWTTRFLNIPFKVHGRSCKGLDCWGLICLVYREEFNIELPQYNNDYIDIEDLTHLCKLYAQEADNSTEGWVRVLKGQELKGDVFLIPLAGVRSHVALCVEPGLMMHITEDINVSVEEYQAPLWAARFRRAQIYRHPKVAT